MGGWCSRRHSPASIHLGKAPTRQRARHRLQTRPAAPPTPCAIAATAPCLGVPLAPPPLIPTCSASTIWRRRSEWGQGLVRAGLGRDAEERGGAGKTAMVVAYGARSARGDALSSTGVVRCRINERAMTEGQGHGCHPGTMIGAHVCPQVFSNLCMTPHSRRQEACLYHRWTQSRRGGRVCRASGRTERKRRHADGAPR